MVSAARPALTRSDQRWLQVLGALLPAGFRDRQRGEWAADLAMLSHDRSARRRYLFGAARTLPLLRAATRGHDSVVMTPGRPSAVTAWRIVTPVLAWVVIGWLSTVLVPYLYVESRGGASEFDMWGWFTGPAVVLTPLFAVLFWGGLVTLVGPVLLAVTATVTALAAMVERRRGAAHRLGTAAVAVAVFVAAAVQGNALYNSPFYADGDSVIVLAAAGVPLLTRAAGLSTRRRVVLGALIAAATAIVVLYHTPYGHGMAVWLAD